MKALVYIPDMTSISLYSSSDFDSLTKSGILKPSEFAVIPTSLYTNQVMDNYCEEKQTFFKDDGLSDDAAEAAAGYHKVAIDHVVDHKTTASPSNGEVTDEMATAAVSAVSDEKL